MLLNIQFNLLNSRFNICIVICSYVWCNSYFVSNYYRSFMTQKGYNVPGWTCDKLPHSCQQDCSSCGPFVLKFAECFLKDEPLQFSTSEEANLKNLCHLCGERNSGQQLTNWIGCDVCPRSFHCNCVQRSRKQKLHLPHLWILMCTLTCRFTAIIYFV